MNLPLLLIAVLPVFSFAENKINLAPQYKIEATPPTETTHELTYMIVERGGIRYKKFEGESGILYVIDSQPLTQATIESGQCFYRDDDKKGGERETVELIKGYGKLSESEWNLYASLIQKTEKNRCNNFQKAEKKDPSLELGLSKTVKNKNGMDTEYKVFNKNLGPNLNFGGQF